MYDVLTVILTGFVLLGVFVLGMLFMRTIIYNEQQNARYDALHDEYYRLAGVKYPSDPKPYVPPCPVAPRMRAMLPGMDTLGRYIRSGKRGTLMWKAGDRYKSAE